LALQRVRRDIQMKNVEKMLAKTDLRLCKQLYPCRTFIGLSGMAVASARMASVSYGAQIIIDRGSQHVLTQRSLVSGANSAVLTANYVERELASYESADYISIPSTGALNSFLANGFPRDKLFVNPYGVDFDALKPTIRMPGEFTVGFLGNWSYQKGVDLLDSAIGRTRGVRLLHGGTVGDIPFPHRGNCLSLGHISRENLSKFFQQIDVLVLPSRQDGFGLVLLEALASGVPVIASDRTGGPDIRDAIKASGCVTIVGVETDEELRDALVQVRESARGAKNDLARSLLTKDDREYFSWRSYTLRYLDFIRANRP